VLWSHFLKPFKRRIAHLIGPKRDDYFGEPVLCGVRGSDVAERLLRNWRKPPAQYFLSAAASPYPFLSHHHLPRVSLSYNSHPLIRRKHGPILELQGLLSPSARSTPRSATIKLKGFPRKCAVPRATEICGPPLKVLQPPVQMAESVCRCQIMSAMTAAFLASGHRVPARLHRRPPSTGLAAGGGSCFNSGRCGWRR
jgi:hypothetical protein